METFKVSYQVKNKVFKDVIYLLQNESEVRNALPDNAIILSIKKTQ